MMRRIYRDGGVSPLPKEDVEVGGPYHIAALVFEAVRDRQDQGNRVFNIYDMNWRIAF